MATKSIFAVGAASLFFALSTTAIAHGDDHGTTARKSAPAMEKTAFGQTGDPKKVTRTITVGMDDSFHYTPHSLKIKKGETVRIIARNDGKLLHEIVIGNAEELKAHAELMRKFPTMEHEAAYMAHVPPGKSEQIVWQFSVTGDFKFACLVAGHSEAGMIGDIVVR
ncbi:MAG: cupredoxin family protein [Betaproteobacteria bacterium]